MKNEEKKKRSKRFSEKYDDFSNDTEKSKKNKRGERKKSETIPRKQSLDLKIGCLEIKKRLSRLDEKIKEATRPSSEEENDKNKRQKQSCPGGCGRLLPEITRDNDTKKINDVDRQLFKKKTISTDEDDNAINSCVFKPIGRKRSKGCSPKKNNRYEELSIVMESLTD